MPLDSHGKAGDRERRKSPSLVCVCVCVCVCVEPALIPMQGVLPARVLTRVETVTPQSSKVTSQTGCVESGQAVNRAHVVVANFSDEPLTIPKATVISVAEPVSENMVNLVNSGEERVVKLRTKRSTTSC